jgi:hypothetical protein
MCSSTVYVLWMGTRAPVLSMYYGWAHVLQYCLCIMDGHTCSSTFYVLWMGTRAPVLSMYCGWAHVLQFCLEGGFDVSTVKVRPTSGPQKSRLRERPCAYCGCFFQDGYFVFCILFHGFHSQYIMFQ